MVAIGTVHVHYRPFEGSLKQFQGDKMIFRKHYQSIFIVFMAAQSYSAADAASFWDKRIENALDNVSAKVYRSATCGCCKKWIEHIRQHTIVVDDNVLEQSALYQFKREHGIAANLQSCHTAIVGSYLVEGHVPAADIMRMVREKPEIAGLSVPQMVTGSPGMEMGGRKDAFSVISFDRSGEVRIYNQYRNY